MQVVFPNTVDRLEVYRNQPKVDVKLEGILRKDLLEDKLYVEEQGVEQWHRFVHEHGPKPEAYGRYTAALFEIEERLCSK